MSCISLLLSIVGAPTTNILDFNEFIRFFSYILIFLCVYSYLPDNTFDFNTLSSSLLVLIKFFIVFELVIVILQSNDFVLDIISLIWNMEKYWPLRRIGTCDNPNTLSILITICYSFVYIFEKRNKQSFLFFCMSFVVIVFSGSRTGLITFFLVFLLNYLLTNKITIKKIFVMISCIILLGSLFYWFLEQYKTEFAYMAEILQIFENGNVNTDSVTTMSIRQEIWKNGLEIFNKSGVYTFFLGTGPGKGTSIHIIDNDYLSIYIKTGIIGAFLNIIFWLGNLLYFYINREKLFSRAMISIILVFSIAALTGAVFASWYLALFFFYFCTFAIKEIHLK